MTPATLKVAKVSAFHCNMGSCQNFMKFWCNLPLMFTICEKQLHVKLHFSFTRYKKDSASFIYCIGNFVLPIVLPMDLWNPNTPFLIRFWKVSKLQRGYMFINCISRKKKKIFSFTHLLYWLLMERYIDLFSQLFYSKVFMNSKYTFSNNMRIKLATFKQSISLNSLFPFWTTHMKFKCMLPCKELYIKAHSFTWIRQTLIFNLFSVLLWKP